MKAEQCGPVNTPVSVTVNTPTYSTVSSGIKKSELTCKGHSYLCGAVKHCLGLSGVLLYTLPAPKRLFENDVRTEASFMVSFIYRYFYMNMNLCLSEISH